MQQFNLYQAHWEKVDKFQQNLYIIISCKFRNTFEGKSPVSGVY